MIACKEGNYDVAILLLGMPSINVNLQNKDGETALMLAAGNGHLGIVKLLLHRSETNVNGVDNSNRTALMKASWKGHLDIIQELIHFHADVDVQDITKGTALTRATRKAFVNCVRLLLENGANPVSARVIAMKSRNEELKALFV
jgi:ankyrin repeat protein